MKGIGILLVFFLFTMVVFAAGCVSNFGLNSGNGSVFDERAENKISQVIAPPDCTNYTGSVNIQKNSSIFTETPYSYETIEHLTDVGGKLAFYARTHEGEGKIVYDGKEIAYTGIDGSSDYRYFNILNISDRLTYSVGEKGKNGIYVKTFIVYGNQEIRRDGISCPVGINNKIAFRVYGTLYNDTDFIVYDGKEIREYGYTSCPFDINGKLAFSKSDYSENFFATHIYYGGQELGTGYSEVDKITDYNGKILFTAIKTPTPEGFGGYYLVEDGKVIAHYLWIGKPYVIGDKLAYKAQGFDKKFFILYDGKNISGNYNLDIDQCPMKLLGSTELLYCYDGDLYIINNKVAFLAKINITDDLNNEKHIIIYGNKEYGREYSDVSNPFEWNGKLAYIARDSNGVFIVYDNQKLGPYYYSINSITKIGGKLVFIAKHDFCGNPLIVMEK